MNIETRKFIIEVDVDTEKFPNPLLAADMLLDVYASLSDGYPDWVFSINGVDPMADDD